LGNLASIRRKMEKKKPTGFIAICQCGKVVGAMDYQRTDKSEAGKILGKWLHDGCTVKPRFGACWEVRVLPCSCGTFKQTVKSNQRRKYGA